MVVMSIVRYLRGPAGLCKSFKEQQKEPVALDKTYFRLFRGRAKGREREGSGWIGEERATESGEEVG